MSMVFVESPSVDPRFNLALEQYVFDCMDKANEYFMLWQNANTIVVGRYQNTAEEVNLPYVREQNITVVRRLSGGGAVYHDLGNLNFTFVVDAEAGKKTIDLPAFCAPVANALCKLGAPAEVNGRNDITIDGKKFSGNAQYIKNGRVMHHGTLLFDADLGMVSQALRVSADKIESKGVKSVRSRVTNIKPYLPEGVTVEKFREMLVKEMFAGQEMERYTLTEADLAAVEKIQQERYDTWEWNFGASPTYNLQKRRRVEGVGGIEVSMQVENGVIKKFLTHGDYFGSGNPQDVADALIGCRMVEEELLTALQGLDIGWYYLNLSREELARIIAE